MKFIISTTSLTIFTNNRPYTVQATHQNWERIKTAIKEGDEAKVLRLIDLPTAVQNWTNTNTGTSEITIKNGQVFYRGEPVHTVITQRILKMIEEDFDAKPLCRFLAKVMKNPSNRAVEQLYSFLEHNNLPIAEDGDFYGYKRIRGDWKDVYSGTIDNSIGQVVSMPRNQVNDDPNETCSHGLHIASLAYLAHYSGERLILTKQSPEHVVSVPKDYNNTKMRVCEYTPVEELDMATIAETDANWKAVYNPTDYDTPVEEDEFDFTDVEDENLDDYSDEMSNDDDENEDEAEFAHHFDPDAPLTTI